MMQQIIEKIEKGKFYLRWESSPGVIYPDSEIKLDFVPLLDEFKLHNHPYVLEHWQAKPLSYRRWGLYCSSTDTYHSVDYDKYIISNFVKSRALQIPDGKYPNLRPTAVKVYHGAAVRNINDLLMVMP